MRELPTGTVTLLFTDIEGSTRMLQALGREEYVRALTEHRRLLRDAFTAHGGIEVEMQGDSFFFAFAYARDAVAAAAAGQRTLAEHAWESQPIKVRIGLHTGEPMQADGLYAGLDVHQAARVMSAAHGGQVLVTLRTAELVEGELAVGLPLLDLGEHRLKDFAAPQQLYQLGEGSFPPLKTISNTNLPRPASSFVGRDRELADVLARIGAGARLLTLTGPGGSGKTRLAVEAAASLVPEYKAGVFWVGLATLRDAARVTETIAQTLGAGDGLPEHIADRELLLLLDNLEQVIEAAPELASLLESCPNLTLLVTSRELLRVHGEVEYPVPALVEPEAVALFCERAQTEPNDDVRALCRRLDSLPLGVELAAARAKVLSPAQILERLSQSADLLKGGRDADPRQQTLRATIGWSYDLLTSTEQTLFRRLSVFVGGCTLEAAEEVCAADVDTLQSLVEKSLVRFSNERFWMLETIREYAGERLAADAETDEMRRRHAEYGLRLAESLGLAVEAYEKGGAARYEVAVAEGDNLRAGIAWGLERNVELALRTAVALEQFWVAHNPFEGVRTLTALLARVDGAARQLLARGHRCLGGSLTLSGDFERAKPQYEQSLALYEEVGDEWGVVHMRHRLATTALAGGDWTGCGSVVEENLARARALGSRYLEGEALSVLGLVMNHDGAPEVAVELIAQSLEIAREVGFQWREAIDLSNLADLSLALGRPEEAEEYARAALALSREMDDRLSTVQSLALLAQTAKAEGDAERAGRIWGAIEAEEARAPLGRWEQYRDEYEASVSDGSPEFDRGRREGHSRPLEIAVERELSGHERCSAKKPTMRS